VDVPLHDLTAGQRLPAVLGEMIGREGGFDILQQAALIRGHQMEQGQGRRGVAHHLQRLVQDHGGQIGGGEQVLHEGLGLGQLLDFPLELAVEGGQLLV